MLTLKKIFLALALFGTGFAANASEGTSTFGGITLGSTSDKIERSKSLSRNLDRPNANGIIGKDTTWGMRLGQQTADSRYYATYDNVSGSHNGLKLRQENLLGSYDVFVPVGTGTTTKLFGGASMGMTKLSQESPATSRSTDVGYVIGAQAGLLQQISSNASLELGYRYLRSNARVGLSEHSGPKNGSLILNSSAQTYLAANYHF